MITISKPKGTSFHVICAVICLTLIGPVIARAETFTLSRHSGGTLYVDVVIDNKVTAPFLVDTGSGLLTLNKTTFNKWRENGEVVALAPMAARLANGKIQKVTRYQISSVSINGRCEIGPIDVAVMPGGANILGINALMKAAPVTITPSMLALDGCSTVIAKQANR